MRFRKILLSLSLLGFMPCLMSVSEPPTTQVEEDKTITLEDTDNNGIPDTIEDYYNEHIRDQYAFGIGLGSIIGFASSIVAVIVMVVKNGKSNKLLKENATQNSELIEKIREEIKEKDTLLEKQIEENKKLVEKINELSIANLNRIKDASNTLKSYARFENKINASLDCFNAIGKSPDYVKNGIGSEINKIVGSVKNGEQK